MQMDRRVEITAEALTSIGRYVAGYPGRKNLLWISSNFPIKLNGSLLAAGSPRLSAVENRPIDSADNSPTLVDDDSGYSSYAAQIRRTANVLSDAKVAVYPINPAGVQPHALFEAETRPRDYSAQGTADTLSREITMLADEDRTMRVVAEDTGGVVCSGSNDLGDCIRKAVDDSSSFYEIAYYPDSAEWNGEYRKIILQSKRSGLQLEYRHGYFAGVGPHENQKADLQQAACEGYLTATSIFFAATQAADLRDWRAQVLPGNRPSIADTHTNERWRSRIEHQCGGLHLRQKRDGAAIDERAFESKTRSSGIPVDCSEWTRAYDRDPWPEARSHPTRDPGRADRTGWFRAYQRRRQWSSACTANCRSGRATTASGSLGRVLFQLRIRNLAAKAAWILSKRRG